MRKHITAANARFIEPLSQVQCGWITQVAWSPDGISLAVAGAESVRLYVGKFGDAPSYTLDHHAGHVKSVAFSPVLQAEGRKYVFMASSSSDTQIKLWDASDLRGDIKEIGEFGPHGDSIDGLAFGVDSHERLLLAATSADGTVTLYDVLEKRKVATLRGHESEVTAVTFALDGHVMFTGSWDKTVRLWDIQGETEGTVIGTHDDWVRDVTTNPTGTMVASAGKDMTVRLWDTHSGDEYAVISAHPGGADCVRFSPDGTLLATGGRDNVVRLWDVSDTINRRRVTLDHALTVLEGHTKPVMTLDFNRPGTLLATGGGDNLVKLWSVQADSREQGRGGQTALLQSD